MSKDLENFLLPTQIRQDEMKKNERPEKHWKLYAGTVVYFSQQNTGLTQRIYLRSLQKTYIFCQR